MKDVKKRNRSWFHFVTLPISVAGVSVGCRLKCLLNMRGGGMVLGRASPASGYDVEELNGDSVSPVSSSAGASRFHSEDFSVGGAMVYRNKIIELDIVD